MDTHFSGPGERVIVFHGYLSSPLTLRKLGRFLNRRGYDVRIPLLPGHGQGQDELESTTVRDYLDFPRNVLDSQEGDDPLWIGGFSLGALLALHCHDHPRVKGLLLMSTPLIHAGGDVQTLKKDFETETADLPPALLQWSEKSFEKVLAVAARVREDIRTIQVPVLALHGGRDSLTPRVNTELLESLCAKGDFEKIILETKGHILLLRNETEIAKAMISFMTNRKS